MKIASASWTAAKGWQYDPTESTPVAAQIVFLFGSRQSLTRTNLIKDLQARYPAANVVGCSTAGEIHHVRVLDDSLIATGE